MVINLSVGGLCFPHLCSLNSGRVSINDLEMIYDGLLVAHFSLLKWSYKGRSGSVKREREEDKERKPRKRINLFMNLFVQRLFY